MTQTAAGMRTPDGPSYAESAAAMRSAAAARTSGDADASTRRRGPWSIVKSTAAGSGRPPPTVRFISRPVISTSVYPAARQHRKYTVAIGEAEGPGLPRTSERRHFDNVGNRRDGNGHPRVRRQRLPDHHRDPSSGLQGAAKMRKGRNRFVEEHHPEAGEQHVERAGRQSERRGVAEE